MMITQEYVGTKRKGDTRKNNNKTCGNKPESTGEKGRSKRYQQRVKQYRQNRAFQNNERKFYQQLGVYDKNIPTTGCKRNRTFLDRSMATKKYKVKAEWINNMTRELKGLEEGPKSEIHIDLLKTTQKYQTGKHQATMEYTVSG